MIYPLLDPTPIKCYHTTSSAQFLNEIIPFASHRATELSTFELRPRKGNELNLSSSFNHPEEEEGRVIARGFEVVSPNLEFLLASRTPRK